MDGKSLTGIVLAAILSLSGCTHHQLRWNTTHQAYTLTDIYEQQVLDNLARIIADPGSLPSFAYPNQGAANVTDNGQLNGTTTWNPFGFVQQTLTLSGSRNMHEAWTLTPVHDVRRLELMRCAYQQALLSAGRDPGFSVCPDCDKIQRAFYLGSPEASYGNPDTLANWTARTGRTTPACFQAVKWFGVGDKKCVPKEKCLKKGHYCGTYVWVCPAGQEELTKLTLTILDYAFTTPPPRPASPAAPMKAVVWYYNDQGQPVTPELATQQVQATIPFDSTVRPPAATELPTTEGVMEAPAQPPLNLSPILPPSDWGFSPLRFELLQESLAPQIETLPAPQ